MAARRNVPATQGNAQTRQLQERRVQIDNVRSLLDSYKDQMAVALPRHLTPDRMLRLTMTCIANEPKLLTCTKKSLVGCVMQLAQLGLEPGILGHAYLLPYKNKGVDEAQIIVGYKGLLKLARNSGEISTVSARVVYLEDVFEYSFGLVDKLHHVPTELTQTADDLTHAYAVVHLKDGGVQWDVMNKREVLEVKSSSRAGDRGPWKTHPAEMWKKSVLRRICKLLPASVELQTAITLDENVDAGIPQTFDVIDLEALGKQDDAENNDQSDAGQSGAATDGAPE